MTDCPVTVTDLAGGGVRPTLRSGQCSLSEVFYPIGGSLGIAWVVFD